MAGPGVLIVVSGLPGSGKTIQSERIAEERAALRLCPDDWLHDLGAGLWEAGLRERVEQLQWRVAKDVLRLGGSAVVEWGTWTREERDVLREGARALGARVELIFLDPPFDELWRSVRSRGIEHPAMTREHLEYARAQLQRPDDTEAAAYDAFVHVTA